ncbi:glycosyltransferase family 4 protein [Cytophagaceae bacterium YF14B1]|uniref:Glycosyltransferase family 4 protein n=2 Tax=Xanthocytophaga flava TaxID=3048013 RepID=A0AAE3UA01_9BACT|nr:glycosyltransferase family 4 protein [Xanthocytophaga flavus]
MQMNEKPVKILVVGQTPPPYMGQAMMIKRLVDAEFDRIKIYHVRMSFSDSFKSVGNFRFKKIFHLFEVIGKVLKLRFSKNVDTLYYPPAGPNRTPIMRDIILLGITRMFFKKVIYHFRAAGISDYLEQQPGLFKKLAKWAYGSPDASIQLSALNPADGKYFNSDRVYIIHNGLEDAATPYLPLVRAQKEQTNILFVGVLREDKGVTVLIEAACLLKNIVHNFSISLVGEFVSNEYENEVMAKVQEYNLQDHVQFLGTKTGDEKWQEFVKADIFCFPSYFESESFGNVLVEAMMFELPVVSTLWRGIPDIVVEGDTGFLVQVQQPQLIAEKLLLLMSDPALQKSMGKKGRERYLQSFSLQKHLKAMEETIETVVGYKRQFKKEKSVKPILESVKPVVGKELVSGASKAKSA